MNKKSNDFGFDFMPKTDDTFIAPNEKFNSFNSFTPIFSNNFSFDTKVGHKSNLEDKSEDIDSSFEDNSKRKANTLSKKSDKFIDFIVNQYKSDGFISTLDENERQIYYCYYCHQYVSDFDLIKTHIDSSKHLNSILNGISLDRGLDKEFVIESINEKKPNNIQKLIRKELPRIPLHLKHYYFRNNIRLMDVLPPNSYFCKSCSESIPNFKSIDTHLLTEKHILSQRKPSLMEMIEKSNDPTLKIGLQYITEERIADSSQVVYECELCNCFDCNNNKMFSHIKSRDHRINLLKRYDFVIIDLKDEELENMIKELHEKHGSGLMKTTQNKKKLKTDAIPTLSSLPTSNSIISPESTQNLSQSSRNTSESKENQFLKGDIFLSNFEDHKIIETYESDGREIYYCCFCDEYYNSFSSMKKHLNEGMHKKFQLNSMNISKGLDKKLSMKRIIDSSLDSNDSNNQSLENIPILTKHFYFKRGIKHLSDDLFYCRFCQIQVQNFESIKTHFESESHSRIEEIPTKFNDLLFQTNQPIIGLKYIKELINDKSKHIRYECTLCDYSQDFCQMVFHLNCFTHQYKVLKKYSPNNKVFKDVKEKEVSFKSSELIKNEILRIEEEIGSGFVTKFISVSPKESPNDEMKSNFDKTNVEIKEQLIDEQKESESPPIKSPLILDNCPLSESSISPRNEIKSQSICMTEEELLTSLKTLFSVHLESEDEASLLVAIVESLKDNLIKYYKMNPIIPKPLESVPKTKIKSSNPSEDNYEICQMEEC